MLGILCFFIGTMLYVSATLYHTHLNTMWRVLFYCIFFKAIVNM